MALKMPQPVKDKNSGVFYIRLRVPVDLVSSVGRKEVSKSLRTRDPATAKERFIEQHAAFQKRWATLRALPEPLPLKRILALAGRVYARLMEALEDEPGETEIWQQVLRLSEETERAEDGLERWYGPAVDELLVGEELAIDAATRSRLLQEVHKAWVQAAEQQLKRSEGDFSPDPKAHRFPTWEDRREPEGLTLTDLFELWKKEHLSNGKSPDTIRVFQHKKDSLADYLGHEDLSRIEPRNVSEWCDHLRHEKGLAPKTVRDKYLTAVRAMFRLARSKFLISSDATAEVVVKVPKKRKTRPQGFTDAEAKQILQHADRALASASNMSFHNKLACRWVPWICAYTGARVGEITQLRTEDFTVEDGIPVLKISPEAGTVKTGDYRLVPVHPHLEEMGLLDFVRSSMPGYLFHSGGASPEDAIRLSRNARDKIRTWVRQTAKFTDDRVQPNHGWRHRFKTQSRDAGIAVEYYDALQGHAKRTAGEDYGEFSTKALYREICKLPRIEV